MKLVFLKESHVYRYNHSIQSAEGKKQITWYPTVIRGVDLQITAGRNRSTTGLENADSAKVFIKYENSNEKMLVETSPEEKKRVFKTKVVERLYREKSGFHVSGGNRFFYSGRVSEVAIMDADYEDGFLSYMSDRYDDLFLVNKADLYKTIPHLEIGGR